MFLGPPYYPLPQGKKGLLFSRRMSRNQIIVIAVCALIGAGIYLFAPTHKAPEAKPGVQGPMAGGGMQAQMSVEKLDIEAYITDLEAQTTDAEVKDKVKKLKDINSFNELAEEYKKLDKPIAAAYYLVKGAEQSNTAKTWVAAGDYNAMLLQTAPDEKALHYLTDNAIHCYEQASNLDPANNEIKLRLAEAYIEGGSNPMQGVTILRDMVAKDSTNIDAQLMLARFGLVSGQFDKTIARCEKVLYLSPQNPDALLMMAQAYEGMGNTEKAIEALTRCVAVVKEPEAKKAINAHIDELKKQRIQ